METLFAFDKRNYRDCQNAFRGPRNREYYSGDYSIESGSVIDVRAERKAIGSSSIIRLRSRTRLFFRRTWTHIREDATDVAILCFVKRGRIHLSHACGETVARPGDFLLTKSMTPFATECQPGEDGVHEVLHLTVPMHLLRRVGCNDVSTGFCVAADSRKFAIAERILNDLFEDAGELKESVAQLLVDTALTVLAEAIFKEGMKMIAAGAWHATIHWITPHRFLMIAQTMIAFPTMRAATRVTTATIFAASEASELSSCFRCSGESSPTAWAKAVRNRLVRSD